MKKRPITMIILHCSASSLKTTVQDIKRWHKDKGWKDIGYHFVIEGDGLIRHGRDINISGAHCEGYNEHSIGICLVGGYDGKKLHKFNNEQMKALRVLLDGIFMSYGPLPIKGHYELNRKKSCPCFDVDIWLNEKRVRYTVKE